MNKQIDLLRKKAHHLNPVILIGAKKGLTAEVHKEINFALTAHELIKIKIATDDRAVIQIMAEEIIAEHQALLVQIVGKTVIVFRENPEKKKSTAHSQ
jgi:RNA-binding protein